MAQVELNGIELAVIRRALVALATRPILAVEKQILKQIERKLDNIGNVKKKTPQIPKDCGLEMAKKSATENIANSHYGDIKK